MRILLVLSCLFLSTCLYARPVSTAPDSLLTSDLPLKESIMDSTILIPDGLESALDSLLSDWFMQHHVYMDSLCVSDVVNPEFHDSIYVQRLASLPNVIEMPYNQIVRSYINMYAQRKRTLVEYMLGLGSYYFPIFEEILDRYELPMELKYLPIIESALKPTARSRMGATGLWQFMLPTGKALGLEITSLKDDRCDPIRATEAAARYLKQLYGIYEDWNLAIAAYNCGPGNVNKADRKSVV